MAANIPLLEAYNLVFDAIREECAETCNGQKTANSKILGILKTKDYYDRIARNGFVAKITTDNVKRTLGNGDWQCNVCDNKYTGVAKSTNFKYHVMIHHMFLKPYNCDECQISFAHRANLKDHRKKRHITLKNGTPIYILDNDDVKCVEFIGKEDGEQISQLYYFPWTEKQNKEEIPVSISIGVTTLDNVEDATKLVLENCIRVAKLPKKSKKNGSCSYRHRTNDGWTTKYEDARPLNIFVLDSKTTSARMTVKWFLRIVTNASCHQKPEDGLHDTKLCQDQLMDQLKKILPDFPEPNQQFFNDQQWKKGKSADTEEPPLKLSKPSLEN